MLRKDLKQTVHARKPTNIDKQLSTVEKYYYFIFLQMPDVFVCICKFSRVKEATGLCLHNVLTLFKQTSAH